MGETAARVAGPNRGAIIIGRDENEAESFRLFHGKTETEGIYENRNKILQNGNGNRILQNGTENFIRKQKQIRNSVFRRNFHGNIIAVSSNTELYVFLLRSTKPNPTAQNI